MSSSNLINFLIFYKVIFNISVIYYAKSISKIRYYPRRVKLRQMLRPI